MEREEFAAAAAEFAAFHRGFAPLFRRRETARRSKQYLNALLVQRGERRNAENLAEAVEGASARALQRLLGEAGWADRAVRDQLQRYLAGRLSQSDGVFILDETGFPKQGAKSAGVARQYSGTLGKVGNCQMGVFLAYASVRGHALVDAALYLPEAWAADRARCDAAGVPASAGYRSKAQLGLDLLRHARAVGALAGRWVTADEGYGRDGGLRDALDAGGWWYVLEVPAATPVFAAPPAFVTAPQTGRRGPAPTRQVLDPQGAQPQPAAAVLAGLPPDAWRELAVAEGAQGPRAYQFAAVRVWESRAGLPGRECWLLLRRNLDGAEPKCYLANAPADTPLLTLAQVGAARWCIETGFRQGKGEAGLDEYEVRGWGGWHRHITLALLALAFLLTLQQDWGGKGGPADADPPAGRAPAAPPAAPPPLDHGGPAALAARHPGPQRAGAALPRPAAGAAA